MTQPDLQLRRLGYLQQVIALADQDPAIAEFLHDQLHEILVYARLKGHEVTDWSDDETYL
jgi:hypothetical protein